MEQLNFRQLVAIARRRKSQCLATFGAIFLLSVLFAAFWPPKYRSIGTVQIVQPDIPQEILSPVGEGSADAIQAFADLRIEQINQKITATDNLVDIITKFNLYPDLRKSAPMAAAVSTMQKRIKLELLSSDLANPTAAAHLTAGQLAAIAFTISFDYSDPLVSQQVDNELISRFIDADLKIRRQQAAALSLSFWANKSNRWKQPSPNKRRRWRISGRNIPAPLRKIPPSICRWKPRAGKRSIVSASNWPVSIIKKETWRLSLRASSLIRRSRPTERH